MTDSPKNIIDIANLSVEIKGEIALDGVDMSIRKNAVTAILGPSDSGKTVLIKTINRLIELDPDAKIEGDIYFENKNTRDIDQYQLRRDIGMIFRQPIVFPSMSIYENALAAYKLNGIKLAKSEKDRRVEELLKFVSLWDSAKEALHRKPKRLSKAQRQKLCFARSLALQPKVLLLDDPCSQLDPIDVTEIEKIIVKLKSKLSVVIVTYDVSQVARISDYAAFISRGKLVEYGPTKTLLTTPKHETTENFLIGKH